MQKYVECDLQQSKSREREKWTMWDDWALSCAVVESLLYLSRRLLGCLNKTKQRLTQASCRPHSALNLCVNKSNWFAALIWFQSDFARHFQTFAFFTQHHNTAPPHNCALFSHLLYRSAHKLHSGEAFRLLATDLMLIIQHKKSRPRMALSTGLLSWYRKEKKTERN